MTLTCILQMWNQHWPCDHAYGSISDLLHSQRSRDDSHSVAPDDVMPEIMLNNPAVVTFLAQYRNADADRYNILHDADWATTPGNVSINQLQEQIWQMEQFLCSAGEEIFLEVEEMQTLIAKETFPLPSVSITYFCCIFLC